MNLTVKKNLIFRKRKIGSKNILFYHGKCFELNETADFILSNIEGETAVSQIIRLVSDEFHIEPQIIENEVMDFISEMISEEVLVKMVG